MLTPTLWVIFDWEIIFAQPFYNNFYDDFPSHTHIIFLPYLSLSLSLSLSIALVFVSIHTFLCKNMQTWQQSPYLWVTVRTKPKLTGFPRFDWVWVHPISKHEYWTSNGNINTQPEPITKPVSNVKNQFIIPFRDNPTSLTSLSSPSTSHTLSLSLLHHHSHRLPSSIYWIMYYNIEYRAEKY